jgi:hypothetical protein
MRTYVSVQPSKWVRDGSWKRLRGKKDAQILGDYFMTAPDSTLCGLFTVSVKKMVEETGLSEGEVLAAIETLEAEGMVRYDRKADFAWVVKGCKHQLGLEEMVPLSENDRRISRVREELRQINRKHPFTQEFFQLYAVVFGDTLKISGQGAVSTKTEVSTKEDKHLLVEITHKARKSEKRSGKAADVHEGSTSSKEALPKKSRKSAASNEKKIDSIEMPSNKGLARSAQPPFYSILFYSLFSPEGEWGRDADELGVVVAPSEFVPNPAFLQAALEFGLSQDDFNTCLREYQQKTKRSRMLREHCITFSKWLRQRHKIRSSAPPAADAQTGPNDGTLAIEAAILKNAIDGDLMMYERFKAQGGPPHKIEFYRENCLRKGLIKPET